ncbi:MAG TPA: CheR family methyltransferase [Pilimelia sp.]|nr:CheR family methyltransferase [Pilimelia sp.]
MTGHVDAASLDRFRERVSGLLGLTLDTHTPQRLAEVLGRRAARRGTTVAGYLAGLAGHPPPGELDALADELTITETFFFRHAAQWRAIADVALPERVRSRAATRALHLLSVGCASGEEAYTLAMVATDALPDPGWHVHVLGVDVNRAALRTAAGARYGAWALRDVPPGARRRWFRRHGRRYEVVPGIRRRVSFVRGNVAEATPALWPRGRYDVILCRNLLMYLHPLAARNLVARMTHALAPGGFLYLGHTDTLGRHPAGLRLRHSHDAFYYQRLTDPPTGQPGASPAGAPPTAQPAGWPAAPQRRSDPRPLSAPPGPDPAAGAGPPTGYVAVRRGASAACPARAAWWRRATDLLRRERYAEALAVVAAADATDAPALLLHALLLAQTGRRGEAAAVCERLLAADGADADAHHLLAMCREEEDPAGAAARYRLAAGLDPTFAMPWLRRGLLARRRGEAAAARYDLDRALALLDGEEERRVLYFGGGFGRAALRAVCQEEPARPGGRP